MGGLREKRAAGAPKERRNDELDLEHERAKHRQQGKRSRSSNLDPSHARATAPGQRTLVESARPSSGDYDDLRFRALIDVDRSLARVRGGSELSADLNATITSSQAGSAGLAMRAVVERRAATLYRRAVDDGVLEPGAPEVDAALALAGTGQALPGDVRRRLERELGVSLARVRVHTDEAAAAAARAVRADAFTVGEDIFFARGAFSPTTRDGQRLLVHELAHVVQAWQGRIATTSGVHVSSPHDALEHEAEAIADRVERRQRDADTIRQPPRASTTRTRPGATLAMRIPWAVPPAITRDPTMLLGGSATATVSTAPVAPSKMLMRRASAEPTSGAQLNGTAVAEATEDGEGTGDGADGARDSHGARRGSRPRPPPLGPATITHATQYVPIQGGEDSRTTVGVGERVDFRASRSGSWHASAVKPRSSARGRGTTYSWYAPATAGPQTVSFTAAGSSLVLTVSMNVIAPSGVQFIKTAREDHFPAGVMGAGMYSLVKFEPFTVVFAAAQWLEEPGPGVNPTDYFRGMRLPYHRPNPRWLPIDATNGGPTDHAAFHGFPGPWTSGTFQWTIKNHYRVDGETTGREFTTVPQICRVEGPPHAGRTTVTKGAASVTREVGGAAAASTPRRRGSGFADGEGIGRAEVDGPGRVEVDGAGRARETDADERGTGEAKPAKKPASKQPAAGESEVPKRGKFLVQRGENGSYVLVFNSADVAKWDNKAATAMGYYMRAAFPGTKNKPQIIEAAIAATIPVLSNTVPSTKKEDEAYEVRVQPGLQKSVETWMATNHPTIRAAGVREGTGRLTDGSGGGGTATKATTPSKAKPSGGEGGADADRKGDDVEQARALYERLRKAFPDSDAWQTTGALYPEFLTFLADHADELKKLPKGKKAMSGVSIEKLKKLLEQFKRHQQAKEQGDSAGEVDGHEDGKAGGSSQGAKGGSDQVTKSGGSKGGSKYGQAGGSKYGWIKWEPKGDVLLRPAQPTYVAGSSIGVELKWDFSVHPESSSILLPNHCSYYWTVKYGPFVVDSDGRSIFVDDRTTNLDLGNKPGKYDIEVVAKSKHFKSKKFKKKITVNVVAESAFSRAAFDASHVTGPDATFSRDAKDKLQVNPGQKALTVDDEITALDTTKGGVDELARQGKLTGRHHDVLSEQIKSQREALAEIQDKVKAGTPYLVRGTFISREDSSKTELRLMMHMTKQQQHKGLATYELILHDLTSGEPTQHPGLSRAFVRSESPDAVFRRLEGQALADMRDHFHSHNDFPKGTVHLAVKRLTDGTVWEKTLDTNNNRKRAKKVLGTVAMVGGVALMIVPGGGALAVGLMVVSGTAGAASVALEIEDRIAKEGKLKFDRRLVLDLLQVVSIGMGFAALSPALAAATRVGKTRFVLAMIGLDAAQGVLLADDTRKVIEKIDAQTAQALATATSDAQRTEILRKRDQQVAEVIGGAVVSGGFMLVSLGGGIKQVAVTSRAGTKFTVSEPVQRLAEQGPDAITQALANKQYVHDNRAVIMTDAEVHFLEGQLLKPGLEAPATKPPADAEANKPPHERTTQKIDAVDPEANKPPHERTTQKIEAVDPEAKKPAHERTTQKMPAVDPSKLPSTEPPTRVAFTGPGDALAIAVQKVPREPGYFDVVVHGSPDSFHIMHNGAWVPVKPNSLRTWLSRQPGYKKGTPIRLISCEAGATTSGIAQSMANGTGGKVRAPTDIIWVHNDGRVVIGADPNVPSTGTWRDFNPGNKPVVDAPIAKPEPAPAPAPKDAAEPTTTPDKAPAPTTPERASAPKAPAERAAEIVKTNGGSVRKSLPELNAQGFTQAEMVEALTAAWRATGRDVGNAITLPDGTVILTSRVPGTSQPVNIVGKDGKAQFGTADLKLKMDAKAPFEASNVKTADGTPLATEGPTRAGPTREKFKTPEGGEVDVAIEGRAVVPTGKVEAYPRGKTKPFTKEMGEELKQLKNKRQTERKVFDADPKNAARIADLEKLKHNYERSVEMAQTLDTAGIPDTAPNNALIIQHLLGVGQTVTPANRVDVRSELAGSAGTVKILSTWTILPDGRAYLSTIKLMPMKAAAP